MTPSEPWAAWTTNPHPIGDYFDYYADGTVQVYRTTRVEPSVLLGIDGWNEDAQPIGQPRAIDWVDRLEDWAHPRWYMRPLDDLCGLIQGSRHRRLIRQQAR